MTDDDHLNDALLDSLFAAITAGDLDELDRIFHDDITVWHNVTDRAVEKAGSLAILRYYVKTVADRRYEMLERHHWPGGAMQRHVVHGRVGEELLRAPVCITFAIRDGQIAAINEYVDSADIRPMMRSPAPEPRRESA